MYPIIVNFKKKYRKNIIVQFLVSYIAVLLIPVILLQVAFTIVLGTIKRDIYRTNFTMLDHSIQLIESELSSLRKQMSQIAYSDVLRNFCEQTEMDSQYFLEAKKMLDKIDNAVASCHNLDISDILYIHLFTPERVIFERSLYDPSTFQYHIRNQHMSQNEWENMSHNKESSVPTFYSRNNTIQYIMPFRQTLSGNNKGTVICTLSMAHIHQLLDFSNEYKQFSLFIFDKKGNTIFTNDMLSLAAKRNHIQYVPPGYASIGSSATISVASAKYQWKYVFAIPQSEVQRRIRHLKLILFVFIFSSAAAGLYLAVYLSCRNGKPVNEVFNFFLSQTGTTPEAHNISDMMGLLQDCMANSERHELFYPPIIEEHFLLDMKSGNEKNVRDILAIIEAENCTSRNLDDRTFESLCKAMIATICQLTPDKTMLPMIPESSDQTERHIFFFKYRNQCLSLCNRLKKKKNANRKALTEQIDSYIRSNYTNPNLGLTQVSSQFCISESYISALYKELQGRNFSDTVESLRINKACLLLHDRTKTIEEVAKSVGYYNVQSFRRAFKRIKGCSPHEIRKKEENKLQLA